MARFDVGDEKVTVEVSEHAIVRYLQRVKGLDVDQVLAEMIPQDCLETIELCNGLKHDRGSFYSCRSHAVVMDRNRVVTVLSPDMVEVPSEEWTGWAKETILRPVPVEGTPYDMAIEWEVRRRMQDKAWQRRQDNAALTAARSHTAAYEKRIAQLESKLEAAEKRASENYDQMVEHGRVTKAKAVKICEHVLQLLGEERYAQLVTEADAG